MTERTRLFVLWLAVLSGLAIPVQGSPQESTRHADSTFEHGLWAIAKARRWHLTRSIVVDEQSPCASDKNPGTRLLPLKSIRAALNRVKPGKRVLLKPGIYRETIELRRRHSGIEGAPVVMEAEKPGTEIISGADIWTGWRPVSGRSGVFSKPWNYTWGFGKDSFAGEGAPTGLRGRRSEMVFVGGHFLRQVFRLSDVIPGTFFVT